MATGYEIGKVRSIEVAAQALRGCEKQLERIADYLQESQHLQRIDPDSLGAIALWREEVAHRGCTIGFTDWQAWHESDKAEVDAAKAAVKAGFDEMEQAMKAEGSSKEEE